MSIVLNKQATLGQLASRASALNMILAFTKSVVSWPLRVHANRILLGQMARMSAHELADIGLTPNDVRDTAALPLDSSVGHFLATRAEARRRVWRLRAR